jgi:hypothetical protein
MIQKGKPVYFLVASLTLLLLLTLHLRSSSSAPLSFSTPKWTPFTTSKWTFDTKLHANQYGLTSSQCQSAFPGLFDEITRAQQHRHATSNLTFDDINRSAVGADWIRFAVHDNHVYIIQENHGVQRIRGAAILSTLQRALYAARSENNQNEVEKLPNIEVVLSIGDFPSAAFQWGLTRNLNANDQDTWIVPDMVPWSTSTALQGEFTDVRENIRLTEPSWEDKSPELLWRGEVARNPLREALQAEMMNKTWGNFHNTDYLVDTGKGVLVANEKFKNVTLSAWDQCKWQYLSYTEGKFTSHNVKNPNLILLYRYHIFS